MCVWRGDSSGGSAGWGGVTAFRSTDELLQPLMLCYRSLHETGDGAIADGHLLDLIRQVTCFGLSLVRLDIRQESERHIDVMDAITTWLGLGSYKAWPSEDSRGMPLPQDTTLDMMASTKSHCSTMMVVLREMRPAVRAA